MFEYSLGSYALNELAKETKAEPLYIILLKDPVQRIMSLYNHWYLQEKGNGYSLDLEELVQLELAILSLPRCKKFIEQMYNAGPKSKGAKAYKAAEALRQLMTTMLGGVGRFAEARLNLRPFGLVLDGLYFTQIHGWLRSQPALRQRLLIIQSEYFKDDREGAVRRDILPFLFPDKTKDQLDAIMQQRKLPKISNEKSDKDPKALLSLSTMAKLARFYKESNIEQYLYQLQQKHIATIVPALRAGDVWWPSYDEI